MHTTCATWFQLNRQQQKRMSSRGQTIDYNSCMLTLFCATVWDDPGLTQRQRADPSPQTDSWLGLSSLGSVLRLDTAWHQQIGANEIKACLISVLRPLSPLVISWVNDQGSVSLGWVQRGGQGGWQAMPFVALSRSVCKHATLWFIVLLEAGRGRALCAEAGARQEYNPFVSTVSVATAVMKNKNWINETYFFLSGLAIRHRLLNLPPVCALRNARLQQSAQLCLNRGPLPVTPGGPAAPLAHGGCAPPKEQRGASETPQKHGDRPEKWIKSKKRERVLSGDVCHTTTAQTSSASRLFSRDFREDLNIKPASQESPTLTDL